MGEARRKAATKASESEACLACLRERERGSRDSEGEVRNESDGAQGFPPRRGEGGFRDEGGDHLQGEQDWKEARPRGQVRSEARGAGAHGQGKRGAEAVLLRALPPAPFRHSPF